MLPEADVAPLHPAEAMETATLLEIDAAPPPHAEDTTTPLHPADDPAPLPPAQAPTASPDHDPAKVASNGRKSPATALKAATTTGV